MTDYAKKHNYTFKDYERERGQPDDDGLDPDVLLFFLSTGQRTPKNDKERRLVDQIQEIKDNGQILEIPWNGI